MALAAEISFDQADFGGGIFRGRDAPRDSVYDAVNALVNDERDLFKRGGNAFKSNANAGSTLEGLYDGYLSAGQRTVFWSETAEDQYVLDTNDASPLTVSASGNAWRKWARGVSAGQLLWIPATKISGVTGAQKALAYGGSRKTADPALFSGTFVNGSDQVSAAAASWLTTADAGMIVLGVGIILTGFKAVVKSIDSNTTLTLTEPWAGPSTSGTTQLARFMPAVLTTAASTADMFLAAAGSRLISCIGSRAYYSMPTVAPNVNSGIPGGNGTVDGLFWGSAQTDFHQLPEASVITGADAIRDTVILFTTDGVWTISNMDFDPLDPAGNIQHTISQISKDVILWGDSGIVGWEGTLLVPAVDDAYILSTDGRSTPITSAIRPLYRAYVKAGHKPGMATVYRGHYMLPILDSSNALIDVLVCRLDLRDSRGRLKPAWTRWAGHAAGGAYAIRAGASTRQPRLFGINGQRVTELTDCFDVTGAASDADASTPTFTVETNDYAVGQDAQIATVREARLEYEMAGSGSPTVSLGWSTGPEGAGYTTLTAIHGGGVDDGTGYSTWKVGKKLKAVRLRIQSTSAVTKLILRRVKVAARPTGRP